MKRADKTTIIEGMNADLMRAPHMILACYRGLGSNQANELRSKIRGVGGRYRVIKNRLAKRAAQGTPAEKLMQRFSGPCAIATHDSDPVVLAKTLSDFAKDNPQVELLAGLIDSATVLQDKQIKTLASLPRLEELRAQLLAVIQAPASSLVRLLNTPGGQLARVIDARCEALGKESS